MSHYLSNTVIGSPIAYFPKLARWLKSVNAAVFLGQFIYWHDKTENPLGVYKTAEEIEDETGLSYKEQQTARKLLKRLGLITETYKRLDHRMFYKFNIGAFNNWLSECTKGVFPNSRLVSSGETDTEVRGEPNGHIVIHKNTTETTTGNLATPERPIILENPRGNMKATGNTSILESLKNNLPKKRTDGKVNLNVLSLKWKEIRAEVSGGYCPELTGKDLGFLKHVLKDFESRSLEALEYIAENWAVFAEKACQSAGIESRPTKPNLAFIAQNRAVLWELLQGTNTQVVKTQVVSEKMATVVPEIGESDDALFDALK